jgi:hypothetical protein
LCTFKPTLSKIKFYSLNSTKWSVGWFPFPSWYEEEEEEGGSWFLLELCLDQADKGVDNTDKDDIQERR